MPILIVAAFIAAAIAAAIVMSRADASTTVGILLSVAALILAILLMMTEVARLGISDRGTALGLPPGSIRALLALVVVLGFFLFGWQTIRRAES